MSRSTARWAAIFTFVSSLILIAGVACRDAGLVETPPPVTGETPAPATPTPVTGVAPAPTNGDTLIIRAQPLVNAMIGLPSLGPYRDWEQSGGLSITEPLFACPPEGGIDCDPYEPLLAESFEFAQDLSYLRITVRQGIPWNSPPGLEDIDFGELDAEDVAWFFNDSNANTNPDGTSGDAGDFAAVFGEAVAIDQYTIEIPLLAPNLYVPISHWGVGGATPTIRSKKVFDRMGPTWIVGNAVGTGPYVQSRWVANDFGEIEAVEDHWRITPEVKTLRLIQVPETSSRVAMLQSGAADLAIIDFKLVAGLIDEGFEAFRSVGEDNYVGISFIWSGNLWEEFHAETGEPLEPWNMPSYAQKYPQIGCPWGEDRCPTDPQSPTPEGMSDMERARLVRWAVSYALDRDGMVEALTGGLGTPIYTEYIGHEYPQWEWAQDRTVTKARVNEILESHGWTDFPSYDQPTVPDLENHGWPIQIPYDPDFARQLLEIAGYPNGIQGLQIGAYACEIGELCLEAVDVAITMLDQVGIQASADPADYGAVISPRMRLREQFWPVVKNGDVHSNYFPSDMPFPPVDSSLSRPGWGVGFEAPFLAEMNRKMGAEQDRAARVDMSRETVEWMQYWHLYSGIFQIPKVVVGNPDKIESWNGRPAHFANFGTPEYIRLK